MKIDFQTDEDTKLTGYYYTASTPKALILINPATAIHIGYYKHVIKFFVDKGYNVFVWNYSCFGESKKSSLANSNFRFSDIGLKEIPAAIKVAKELSPVLPLFCLGHSVGGQHIGFVKNRELIDGLVTTGTSAGYILNMPIVYGAKAFFFFYIFSPISTKIFNYVAASKLKLMKDLPSPFVKEWRQWCSQKDLVFSHKFYGKTIPQESYKNLTFPIHVITADDDEISTKKNTENFWKHVSSKKGIDFKTYKAKSFPRKKLGHFGYYKRENSLIWEEIEAVFSKWCKT